MNYLETLTLVTLLLVQAAFVNFAVELTLKAKKGERA